MKKIILGKIRASGAPLAMSNVRLASPVPLGLGVLFIQPMGYLVTSLVPFDSDIRQVLDLQP